MIPTYTIRYLTTPFLSVNQWNSYLKNFNEVFKKNLTVADLKSKYNRSCLGFSFHGVLFYNDEVVGMYTAIPRIYNFFGKETIIAQGCDTFILNEHRKDEALLNQLFDAVAINIKDLGIFYHISIPNNIAYPYWKFYVGCKDIARLNYYILPIRIGNMLKKWKFLNKISLIASLTSSYIANLIYKDNTYKNKYISLKRSEEYFYERFNSDYKIKLNNDGSGFVYSIHVEDGVRTAYLIDCFPLNKRSIAKALFVIARENFRNIDAILFVGIIDNSPFCFLKVPEKREPRQQPFIGYCTNDSDENQFFNISNWEVSLANFDNR